MKTRNAVIAVLAAVGVILFITVYGVILPKWDHDKQVYAAEQLDPLTHDLQGIMKYQNKYMGNASNLSNLIHSLPLSDVESTMELHPEKLTADIIYHAAASDIAPLLLDRSLIYNATAAFALIDNLQQIQFKFSDHTYTATRTNVEAWYGQKCSSLTASAAEWKSALQSRLNDSEYVKSSKAALFSIHQPAQ